LIDVNIMKKTGNNMGKMCILRYGNYT